MYTCVHACVRVCLCSLRHGGPGNLLHNAVDTKDDGVKVAGDEVAWRSSQVAEGRLKPYAQLQHRHSTDSTDTPTADT